MIRASTPNGGCSSSRSRTRKKRPSSSPPRSRWTSVDTGLSRTRVASRRRSHGRADAARSRARAWSASTEASSAPGRRLALDERQVSTRRGRAGQKATEVNPSNLDVLALQGALAFLEARPADIDQLAAQALAINPRFGDVYRVAGAHAARTLPLRGSGGVDEEAVTLDPEDAAPRRSWSCCAPATSPARVALERAFRADPFDVVTYNLLALLDTLDTFQTVHRRRPDDQAAPRRSAGDARACRPARQGSARGAEQAVGVHAEGPILIEMFPRHDDFAVRTLGLPGMIGALGACFGRVVTLDSPKARAARRLQLGRDALARARARHHAAAVEQRVPRWLTEGISVFEEKRARRRGAANGSATSRAPGRRRG